MILLLAERVQQAGNDFVLAIVLSGVVLLAWNYFYGVPQMRQQRDAAQPPVVQQTQSPAPGPSGAPVRC